MDLSLHDLRLEGLLSECSMNNKGLIKGVQRIDGGWYKIVDITSSNTFQTTIFAILSTFENLPSFPVLISCKKYYDLSPTFTFVKLINTDVNIDYGIKVKYKITDNNIKVWVFSRALIISDNGSNIEPIKSDPDEDAIDAILNT